MSDLKFNIDGKDISSEEIKSGKKDFNTFYKNYVSKTKPLYKKGWFWSGAGLASIAILTAVLLNNGNTNFRGETSKKNEKQIHATNTAISITKSNILPFVNPPIDGINVPWEKMIVDAEKGGIVINKRGSRLSFPKMAFVDALGNSIKQGKVEVRYREFMDQIDQIVSGIPMTYDSAGTTYQFLSAGMIEVKGFLNNEEVVIAPDKKINIELVSNTNDPDYNLYNLNVKERNWECMGKPIFEKKEPNLKKEIQEMQKQKEVVDAKLQKIPEYKKLKKKRISILAEINTIKTTKPKEPKEAIKDVPMVNFDFNKNDYPELSEYAKVLFQLDNGQKINPDDASRIWNEVDIEKQNDQYKITFTETPTGYKATYMTNPVYEGKSYKEAKGIFDDKFNDYTKKLDIKKSAYKKLGTKISAVRNRINNDYINDHNKSNSMVMGIFAVESFGTYNLDKPIVKRKFKTGNSPVNLISYNNKTSVRESVFYVNANKNTYLNKYLIGGETLYYRNKGDNFLIIVKGKEFGFINQVQFKNITDKVDGVFDFKDLKTASSLKDLKKQLKFNL